MDGVSVVALIAIVAFAIDRAVAALMFGLSFVSIAADLETITDLDERRRAEKKHKLLYFLFAGIGVCTSLPTTPHLVVGRSACRVGVGPSLNRSWAQRSRPVVQAGRRAFPGDESVVD